MDVSLYPKIKPYHTEMFKVSDLHTIYFEQCGNPEGQPVVFLHGGPGGGISANAARFFDPNKYRIVLIDQRGCGRSTPFSELEDNNTWALVNDIQKIKNHLNIETWAVFGGSWGSTLSLAYAQTHPESVDALFLRGIFMLRKKELQWFYQEGASHIFPDAWEGYKNAIPEDERGDFISAYHKRLTSADASVRAAAANAWSVGEASTSQLIQDPKAIADAGEDAFADAFARIECHYFINKGFMENESQLLDNVDKIRDIPTIIVQGRYDVVCPMQSSWDLHKAWPEANYVVVADAGHAMSETGIRSALINATDNFVRNGKV